jgi:hypothetical protein
MMSDSKDLYEAKANYARIINSLPQTLQRAFQGSFEWQGIKIDSFGFSRPYGMTETLVLTETTRESDSDARNGFRVRSSKTTRINCREDALFIIQDISSSHGNNLRARTLFNEDENLRVLSMHLLTMHKQLSTTSGTSTRLATSIFATHPR